MTETIKTISTVYGYRDADWQTWDGYLVETSERKIRLLVDSTQDCCEAWGMVTAAEDEPGYFIGAKLVRIDWTGTDLTKHEDVADLDLDEGGVMFVDFVTNRGTLQLAVYNSHNGYYGHYAKLVIDGAAVLEETL